MARDDPHTIYLSLVIYSHSDHDHSFDMRFVNGSWEINGLSFLQVGFHLVCRELLTL